MPLLRMKGHPLLRETIGKVALQRGPFVYCMEEADNGKHLHQIRLHKQAQATIRMVPDLLGGIQILQVPAYREKDDTWGSELYKSDETLQQETITVEYIPYYAWANRGAGEMVVWVRD
ncbi:Non-reducing end beta-L-arabinofuranosidase [compost metagenome]